jgi:uncharacterized membrane protein YqjE
METNGKLSDLVDTSKRIAHQLFTIGENRLEILVVEVEEERERILHSLLLALGTAAFGLLAGVALTLCVMVIFWNQSPWIALLVLAAMYGSVAGYLYNRLTQMRRDWRTLSATLEQLRKDRECLQKSLD